LNFNEFPKHARRFDHKFQVPAAREQFIRHGVAMAEPPRCLRPSKQDRPFGVIEDRLLHQLPELILARHPC